MRTFLAPIILVLILTLAFVDLADAKRARRPRRATIVQQQTECVTAPPIVELSPDLVEHATAGTTVELAGLVRNADSEGCDPVDLVLQVGIGGAACFGFPATMSVGNFATLAPGEEVRLTVQAPTTPECPYPDGHDFYVQLVAWRGSFELLGQDTSIIHVDGTD
jgi:hypothetical protein